MGERSSRILRLFLATTIVLTIALGCGSPAPAQPTAAPSGATAPTVAPAAKPTVAPAAAAPAQTAPAAPAAATKPAAKKPSGTVTVGIGDLEARHGLPTNAAAYGMVMLSNVQEQLIYVDPKGNLVPGLAEKWEMSKDGMTVTFHLRKGVQFHGGYGEMTSKDVKFTGELMQSKEARNSVAVVFRDYVQSIDTPDKYTVVFNMKRPSFDIFVRMSNQLPYFTVASKDYVDKVGMQAAMDNWIGTGPWQLVEYQTANYVKFKAVENHWRVTPEFEYLVVKQVPDAATRVMMLKAGDIDATDVTLQSAPELEKAGMKVVTSQGLPFWLVFGGSYLPTRETFRKDIPYAADPADSVAWERARKVRLAMAHAIDKQAILDTIFHGRGKLTAVPGMVPTHPGYDPNWKPFAYDVALAKKLLIEAGYPNGFSTQMYLYSLPGRDELQDVGVAVADMLGKIGIKVDAQKQDYTAVFSPAMQKRQTHGLFHYAYTFPEAISIWDQNAKSTSQRMWFGEHADLDKMIASTVATIDFNERAKKQREIGQWMIDNVWGVGYATKDGTFGINPKKIKDWQLVPMFAYPNQFEYLKRVD